jgi:hypothetical protein
MISELNIFRLFLYNDRFRKKVQSELDVRLFDNTYISELYVMCQDYYAKHMKIPSDNIKMLIYNNTLKQEKTIIEEKIDVVEADIEHYETMDLDVIMPDVEKWLKNKKFAGLLQDGIDEYDKVVADDEYQLDLLGHQQKAKKIMEVSFDNNIGIDVSNAAAMFDEHKRKDRRIRFYSKELNKVTKGGCKIPSLNIVAGPPHSGKTRFLCTIAADYMKASRENKVLYVTLEMSESDISKYVDYLLIDKNETDMETIEFEEYTRLKTISEEKHGNLIVKEYPTSTISTAQIRTLLNELRYKGFVPDILIVDYMGILLPERKISSGMYESGKAVSEELRGLGGTADLVVWTGAQINRTGAQKKGGGKMEDMAESYAINMTGDLILSVIDNDELREHGNQIFSLIKNRPGGRTDYFIFAEIPKDEYRVNFISVDEHMGSDEEHGSDYDTTILRKKFDGNGDEINNNKFSVGIGAK